MIEKRILIPLNIDSHWYLALIEPDDNNIQIYNSQSANILDQNDEAAMLNLALFFKLRFFRVFKIVHELAPQQDNNYDCGFFSKFESILNTEIVINITVLAFAHQLAFKKDVWEVKQSKMQQYRKQIKSSIINSTLPDNFP